MNHETRKESGATVVSFSGDIDLQSSPEVRKILLASLGEGTTLLVDLGAVEYIDSSGVASMVECYQKARKKNQDFILVNVSDAAMRVMQLARLDKVFSIAASIEEALNPAG